MASTEVRERVPWLPIIIVTIIFSFFEPIWVFMLPASGGNWYAIGGVGCAALVTVTPFLFIVGASLLKYVGVKIDDTTLTWLYATGVGLTMVGAGRAGAFSDVWVTMTTTSYINPDRMAYLPWFIAPRAEITSQIVSGGVPIPWTEWIPALIFWWGYWASSAIFCVSLAALLRRQWVDIERMPFPQTLVMNELMRKTTSKGKLSERLGLPFIIGILLGIIFQLPLTMTYLFPWFPDIYGWRVNMCGNGAQWITPDSPLAGIAGFAQFNKNPLIAAILYMAPLNVLLGAVVWNIAFLVLMQAAFVMGYYTGITGNAGCGRVWCGAVGYRVGEPFKWDVFSTAGVGTGLVIFWILLHRRYLADTFRAAFGGIAEEKRRDMEKDEPLSYKNIYIALIGSLFFELIVWLVTDMGIAPALILIFISFVSVFAQTYIYSHVGLFAPSGSTFDYGFMKLVIGEGTDPPTRQWVTAFSFIYPAANNAFGGGGIGFPLVATLASFKMGSLNGVGTKNIFQILMFVSVIAPLLALIGSVWSFYTFGLQKLPTAIDVSGDYTRGWPTSAANRPAFEPWLPHLIAGILFAGLLSYMHARFVWFPFEPIGFLLATDGHLMVEGIWTMVIIAWILKTLTLRIGGSKLYERTGVPMVAGYIIGFLCITILGGIILVTRFFVPF